MAITNALNAPRNSYTSTAGQTAFAVGFEFYQVTDVKVYKNGSLMTYNAAPSNTVTYSITGTASAGDSAYEFGGGGSVVFGSGLTNGDVIVIVRDIAVERTVDFNPSSAFDITTLNTQLDTIIGMIADREKQGDRSVKLLDTDIVAATVTLPLKATRASKVLSFDADGNTETTITSTGLSALNSVTSEIGLLGTSANVTAMGLLGTSAVIADMALLGTTDAIADMALLATSDIVSDLNTLATSDIVADLAILATSDIVSDINTLATSDIVSDLNTLATSAIVTDLSILATSDIVTDINLLATSDIVSDLNTLATSDFVSDLNTLASSTVVTNIATVAANVAGVTSFAARYRVTGGDPGSDNDAGDLNYNTSSNALKYWTGSAWNTIASSYSLDTASDTNLTSPADGAMLLYDTGTSKWIDNVMSGDATMADTGAITIANDAVTADKIADSINSAITANTAKVTNATHTGEVTGATSLTIADNIVDEANLKVSNAPTNGYFLSAQSGNTGGLTWAEVAGGAASLNELSDVTVSTSNPATNTNPSSGTGHIWINKTLSTQYMCMDATTNNNVWWLQLASSSTTNNIQTGALGGTITTDSTYKYHTFLSSGTFTVFESSLSVDVLIVGGGGGGGSGSGGGGGGGGAVYTRSSYGLSAGNNTITIGAGGATNGNGGSTIAFSVTAVGGGGGGKGDSGDGGSSGANGGGTGLSTQVGTGSISAYSGWTGSGGNNGGNGGSNTGGGGGGAGAAGGSSHGGNGVVNALNGTSLYWAGGGGGSYYQGGSVGNGGLGGGGGGKHYATPGSGGGSALNAGGAGQTNNGGAGGANTGGGGGGVGGGNGGGSGIVIVRYEL